MKKQWCQEKWEMCIAIKSQEHKPKQNRVRCPGCKKRFLTVWKTCGDYNCWHEYLPPHKKRINNGRIKNRN
jgi:hypothetical protein